MPTIDLDVDERAAVIAALKEKIDRDRFPRAPRLEPFKSALAKLEPARVMRPASRSNRRHAGATRSVDKPVAR